MNRLLTAMVVLVFTASPRLWGGLFINSIPMKARVTINGQDKGQTPLYLGDLKPGQYTVAFEKNLYQGASTTLQLRELTTNLTVFLTPLGFSVSFPQDRLVEWAGTRAETSKVYRMPSGIYEFETAQDKLKISRVNPWRPFLYTSLGIGAAGLAAGITGLIMANVSYSQFQQAQTFADAESAMRGTTFWDTMTLTGTILGACGLAAGGFFLWDELRFSEANKSVSLENPDLVSGDRKLFDSAMDKTAEGDNQTARGLFTSLINSYPESQYTPVALYRLGMAEFRGGNAGQARSQWERLIREYPVYELYSMTMAELARLSLADKRYSQAWQESGAALSTLKNLNTSEHRDISLLHLQAAQGAAADNNPQSLSRWQEAWQNANGLAGYTHEQMTVLSNAQPRP